MILTDPADDDFLFDGPDPDEPDIARPLGLVVCMPVPAKRPELLNTLEERYRISAKCPVIFSDVDDEGRETLDNAQDFARAMGRDTLPSLAEAEDFSARFKHMEWTW